MNEGTKDTPQELEIANLRVQLEAALMTLAELLKEIPGDRYPIVRARLEQQFDIQEARN
jgi:hypothetical protein